jgi:hypothetical protein
MSDGRIINKEDEEEEAFEYRINNKCYLTSEYGVHPVYYTT